VASWNTSRIGALVVHQEGQELLPVGGEGQADEHDREHVHQQHLAEELQRQGERSEATTEEETLPARRSKARSSSHAKWSGTQVVAAEEDEHQRHGLGDQRVLQQLAQLVGGDVGDWPWRKARENRPVGSGHLWRR
jgi:hypothetical protein